MTRWRRPLTAPDSIPDELVVNIVQLSDWRTLCTWRRTSRTFFTVVAVHLRRRYDNYIKPFVTDVAPFDELLRANGAIISGTSALHFFIPDDSWHPHQLDIYVPANTFKRFIRAVTNPVTFRWVYVARHNTASRIGRTRSSAAEQTYEDLDEIRSDEHRMFEECPQPRKRAAGITTRTEDSDIEILHETGESSKDGESGPDSGQEDRSDMYIQLEHYSRHRPSLVYGKNFRTLRTLRTPTGRRVNVVRSHANNPISPLRCFWSTLTMNFLTPDGCVCGCPSGTLRRQAVVKLEPLNDREQRARQRYERRGYTFGETPLRNDLDTWDYIFFGEHQLLALDFRKKFNLPRPYYPIKATRRGWLSDERWKVIVPREFISVNTVVAHRLTTRSVHS